VAVLVVVVLAAALSTKVVSAEDHAAASADEFDPATYAAEIFESEIVPQIEEDAVPLPELLDALAADEAAAQEQYGNTSGASSSWSYPVSGSGIAGTPVNGLLPVTVEGVDPAIVVYVQIGPAINGTAIRDVTGTISFDQFTNQLEYQQVATELNNLVRDTVLADVDPASLPGATVDFVGAYTAVNPALVSIVPVVFEVQG
jgi:predicted lipoprotein